MDGLERGCDIIKPICERPFNRAYACMCVWCHSVPPAPFIFVWPQARKTEFWHQRPQASAHAPGTKVSLILPLSSLPFSPSPWLSAHCLHTNPFSQDHTARLVPPIISPASHLLSLSALLYFTTDLRTRASICSNCSGRLAFWDKQHAKQLLRL